MMNPLRNPFIVFCLAVLFMIGSGLEADVALAQGGGGITLPNPVQCGDIPCVLEKVVDFLLVVAIPILVIMIIWGAFMMVTAGGNEEQIKKAKKALLWSVVGFAIVTIGWGIAEIVKEILGGRSP